MRVVISLAICCVVLAPARVSGQTCTEPHYRWSEKTADALANQPATRAYVTTILKSWGLPAFTGEAQYKCADRVGRELSAYSITGWVRRVKTAESDGDWHIELTARENSPTDSCIVLEIPPPEYSGNYALTS